jgi:MoaA/NifB/PqqE/SkfB family radical SAM enzyme
MISLLPKIPGFQLFRRFGFPRMLPLNLTMSVTYRCNSRCQTCRVYEKRSREFTLSEFQKTFRSIGRAPYWLTISGGEPFLRDDIVDICLSAYECCHPKIINIPTNGLLPNVIPNCVDKISRNSPDTQIIVNLSLDDVGEGHDLIRRAPGNYDRAMATYSKLRGLKRPNLAVGIHSVISKHNADHFPQVCLGLLDLQPDSYITEIAEERVELGTVGQDIAPSPAAYAQAVDFLSQKIREQRFEGISRITQAFRLQYYDLVKKIIKEKRQVLPCYAGFLSAQVAPDGEVWACCIKAESMGNLRDVGYDFRKIWHADKADDIRKPIRRKQCFCPLANASYTNMLASYRTMAAVLKNLASEALRRRPKAVDS